MIHSRFVSVAATTAQGPLKAMAPFFDLLNHSSHDPPALVREGSWMIVPLRPPPSAGVAQNDSFILIHH